MHTHGRASRKNVFLDYNAAGGDGGDRQTDRQTDTDRQTETDRQTRAAAPPSRREPPETHSRLFNFIAIHRRRCIIDRRETTDQTDRQTDWGDRGAAL